MTISQKKKTTQHVMCGVLLMLLGCGPMNKPQNSNSSPSPAQCATLAGVGRMMTTAFSKNQSFIVQAKIFAQDGSGVVEKPSLGDNSFQFRIIRAEGLAEISKAALVEIDYTRLNSNVPRKFTATVDTSADGLYHTVLRFKHAGDWEITVHVTDGELKDDHVLRISF